MSDESDRLRLGGMALANGLLVHGPTSWAAAVVADDGEVVVGSGPRPRLNGGLFERVPFTRGVIRMVESLMVVPAARAGVPEARLAMESGLSGYEAQYLTLARTLGLPLVSASPRLLAVGQQHGHQAHHSALLHPQRPLHPGQGHPARCAGAASDARDDQGYGQSRGRRSHGAHASGLFYRVFG